MVGFIEEPVVGFLVGSVKGFLEEEIGGLKKWCYRLTFKCILSVYLYILYGFMSNLVNHLPDCCGMCN